MRLITRYNEEGIAKALIQMHNSIEQNTGRIVGTVYDELIAAIRDISRHIGGEAEYGYLSAVWSRDYMPDDPEK